MPTQDIIDNREGILLETVKGLLRDSVSAKFAVGYLFTSGLAPLMNEVQNLNELKLLIGNISSRRTIEQLAEAHMNLVTAKQEFNKQLFMNPSKRKLAVSETKGGIRTSLSLIDQTDDNEQMIRVLRELIEKNKNEEPCGKPQGINSHITNTAAATLWQATGNYQVKNVFERTFNSNFRNP